VRPSTTGLGILLFILCVLASAPTRAEWYVAVQAGATLPQPLTNVDETQIPLPSTPSGTKVSDLALKSAVMYGAKLGYYFDSVKWLGIETEVFRTAPNVKQQSVTETPPGGPSTTEVKPGANLIVTAVTLNLVARAQLGSVEPYVAVGAAGFLAQLNLENRTSGLAPLSISSGRPGLNTQLGLRYRLNEHLAFFGEWKFNYSRFTFDSPAIIHATYAVHHFVFGIGYHFW
jgi:opacity protein-like surface antigen